jgi:phage-related protein
MFGWISWTFVSEHGGAAKAFEGFSGRVGLTLLGCKERVSDVGPDRARERASHHGNAWRAVYTVRFQEAIYVLHVFQKKSTRGIATPTREIEVIKRRLVEAKRDYRERQN